jgi:hypothetical protein
MKSSPNKNQWRCAAISIAALVCLGASAQTTVNFDNFQDLSSLTLNGDARGAVTPDGSVLRLTDYYGQGGSVFLSTGVPLLNNASFSTRFEFRITSEPGTFGDADGPGADGFVFVIQSLGSGVGSAGGGIGYEGITRSVGIEFDTWNNGRGAGDPNGNHVGIDVNGSLQSLATVTLGTRLNDGQLWTAWVDYNGASQDLQLRLALDGVRPTTPLLSAQVNLTNILQSTTAYAGFTSGTGSGYGVHDIESWQFNSDYRPIVQPPPPIPEASDFGLGGAAILGLGVWRWRAARRAAAGTAPQS